jgi:hypothetical protein
MALLLNRLDFYFFEFADGWGLTLLPLRLEIHEVLLQGEACNFLSRVLFILYVLLGYFFVLVRL